MAASATPAAGGGDGSSAGTSLPGEDLEALVDRALKDERLETRARAVGLHRPEIVELARGLGEQLAKVPVDLSGALAQRERERAVRGRLVQRRRTLLSIWAVVGVAIVWILGGTAAALLRPVVSGWSPIVLVAVGVGAVVCLGLLSAWIAATANDRRELEGWSLARSAEAVAGAEDDIQRFRVEEIAKRIRTAINERHDEQYRTTMTEVEGRGLAEVEDPRHLVRTPARERLDRLLRDMPGGSIGLSGPRGGGKSSLIGATCPSGDDQPEGVLGVVVAAPVQFDAREFILHLFAEMCRTILGRDEVERLRTPDPLARTSSGLRLPVLMLKLLAPLVLLAGIGMLIVSLADADAQLVWAVVVTLAGFLACLAIFSFRMRDVNYPTLFVSDLSYERRERFGDDIVRLAKRRLTDIWFQQSFTSGWSGSISLPIGVEGGLEGGQELSRQQMSMPDIVSELRYLVLALTQGPTESWKSGSQFRVLIGIDELDKIDSIDDACRFMNEIKVLFGISRCFFLVSLSEDAMSQFERRGLPMRDVFDSSFDDVVRVAPLSAGRSVALLRERTIGMPIPFMLLCHCMGGGVPRDVIRMAREILPVKRAAPENLSAVCRSLVAAQIAAKLEATLIASRRLPRTPEIDGFQGWLEVVRPRPTGPDELIETCRSIPLSICAMLAAPAVAGNDAVASQLPLELLAYFYFCATVQEFFVDDRPPRVFREATGAPPQASLTDSLCGAHQAFSVHPRAAWEATTRIRQRLECEPVTFPEPAGVRRRSNGASRLSAATTAFVEQLLAGRTNVPGH